MLQVAENFPKKLLNKWEELSGVFVQYSKELDCVKIKWHVTSCLGFSQLNGFFRFVLRTQIYRTEQLCHMTHCDTQVKQARFFKNKKDVQLVLSGDCLVQKILYIHENPPNWSVCCKSNRKLCRYLMLDWFLPITGLSGINRACRWHRSQSYSQFMGDINSLSLSPGK